MSTLWTPSGEYHPKSEDPKTSDPITAGSDGPAPGEPTPTSETRTRPEGSGPSDTDVEELRRQLADAPAEVVVANHCYGLFELAAVYLSQSPPLLPQAQLAIDALGFLVEGLGPRLGDVERTLQDALAQIRTAFVQVGDSHKAAPSAAADAPTAEDGNRSDGSAAG